VRVAKAAGSAAALTLIAKLVDAPLALALAIALSYPLVLWVLGFYIYDSSTLGALLKLGTYGPVLFVFGILGVQALCSFAIIWYFLSKARDGFHWWKTGLAPLLGGVAQIPVMYLVVHNSSTLGGSVWMMDHIWQLIALVFLSGMGIALIYRATDKQRYQSIGRYLHEEI